MTQLGLLNNQTFFVLQHNNKVLFGINRNLVSWSCGSYVSCQVQLKLMQLNLCDSLVYDVNICLLMSSHVEPCQNYIFILI